MSWRGLRRWVGVGALTSAAACSLLVDTSGLDEGCPSGRKFCAGSCVPVNDAAYGCEETGCEPCRRDNGVPRCDGTECVWDTCLYGYGCEQCTARILIDPENCGFCRHACDPDEQTCSAGECVPPGSGGAGGEAGATSTKGTSDSTATQH
jgi:hypothetical protein